MLEDILQSPTSVSLFGVFVALLLLHILHSSFSSQKRPEPPGPRPLPLFGNLFQLDLKRLDQSLYDLSKKYGPVFQVYLGPKKIVVLAGYKMVKQALVIQADAFKNIEITPIFYDYTQGHGIILSNGDSWKEMRRFAFTTLKDFGMGRKMSEEIITEECGYLIKEFEQFEGKTFNNSQLISYSTSNVISALMFGNRFEYSDPSFQMTLEREHVIAHLIGSASIQNVKDMKANMSRIIAELRETLNLEVRRCFVDAFLIHKKHLEDTEIMNSHYHDDNLVHSVMDLIGAGTETTAMTLMWSLLYMAKFPQIQDGVQEELSRVVGSHQIGMEDRKNLPYTDAVIHEIQRLANIAPMALPHTTSKDLTFQGYNITEGTTVIPLLTSVLYDESEWESPHTFNP
ncbi:cytochrome P450 2K1, partial [Austrofundulus limnaeus]|uniref:Cytochrome P450 2K1 n=1 Tax=Austrofundulus limnaeus TaxID=52670 RepID=A0A2I4AMB6_AUSLI